MTGPIVFLDIDGVCTSTKETPGSYLNHSLDDYGLSPKCMSTLKKFLKDINANVIISSNWRINKDKKVVKYHGKSIQNPLFALRKELGSIITGYLPTTEYKQKAQALVDWFDQNEYDGQFVVIDDDVEEHLQDEFAYGINDHLVFVDYKVGFTSNDAKTALEILGIKH